MAANARSDGQRKSTRERSTTRTRQSRRRPERPRRAASPAPEAPAEAEAPALPVAAPEAAFKERVPPAPPERPRPEARRAIFLDVENTSKPQHLAHIIDHLAIDRHGSQTDLVAVANWKVVGQECARLLAQRGAQLVHSAPSTGVRDWSDLRIAVTAGLWLAAARSGDVIEVVSDDRAFDAVGDVAASLGIPFRRLSYRQLARQEAPEAEAVGPVPAAAEGGGRRRHRRRGRGRTAPGPAESAARHRPAPPHAAAHGREAAGRPEPARQRGPAPPAGRPPAEGHTAPHDEVVAVIRELVEASPRRAVVLDAVANALKARGFLRPPGSPRLVTRLRRIREIVVSPSGIITLAEPAGGPRASTGEARPEPGRDEVGGEATRDADEGPGEPEVRATLPQGAAEGPRGRRRRRRRRRPHGGQRRAVEGAPAV